MNHELDSKVQCEICKANVSKYLRFVHEAKCKLAQLTSKQNEIFEKSVHIDIENSKDNLNDSELLKETITSEIKNNTTKFNKESEEISRLNENIINTNNDILNNYNDNIEPEVPLNKLFKNIMIRIHSETNELSSNKNPDLRSSEYPSNISEKIENEFLAKSKEEMEIQEEAIDNRLIEELNENKIRIIEDVQKASFKEELKKENGDEDVQEERIHKITKVGKAHVKDEYARLDSNLSDFDHELNIPRENEIFKLSNHEIPDPVNYELSKNADYDIRKNFLADDNKEERIIKLESSPVIYSNSKNIDDNKLKENQDDYNSMLENKEFMESEPKAATFQFYKKFKHKEENENSINSEEVNKEVEDSIINDSKKLFTEDIEKNINANTPIIHPKEIQEDSIHIESEQNQNLILNEVSKIEYSKSHFANDEIIEANFNTNPSNIDAYVKTNQNEIAPKDHHSNLTNNINESLISITSHPKHLSKERIPKNISYITDETFLQKIEEKELEKEKEVQQTLEEIQQIESRLNLDERLMHEKWQIRKNAFKEISNLIQTFVEYTSTSANKQINPEEKLQMFETFSHWLNYFISDANITALGEGLNTFYVFVTNAPEYRNKAMIDFFDEMEKIVSYHKPNINETSTKIINFCLSNKKMLNFTINELIKKLSSNNNKLLQLVCKIIFEFITNNTNESYIKLIFEKCLFHFSALTVSKNVEKKKLFAKMIQDIFSIIEDDFEAVKKNVKSINAKDLEKLLNGVKKKSSEKKIFIYGLPSSSQLSSQSGCDIRNYSTVDYNDRRESNNKKVDLLDINNYNTTGHHLDKFNTIINEYASNSNNNSNPNVNFTSNNPHQESNPNIQSTPTSIIPIELVDIFSIFPSEFFEIPYIPNFNTKKEILEKLNRGLSNVISIKDRERDHKEILSIINIAIEDSNIFVHLEGIKCLCHLSRLLEKHINQSKLKLVLSLCFDKFKDKKSLIKIELFNLFDCLIVNNCFSLEYFANFALQYASNQKVATVKQHILEYIKLILTEDESYLQNKQKLSEIIADLEPTSYISFAKYLVDIMQTEPQSNIKDICTDILIQCKFHAENSEESYEKFIKMMGSLPNYRSNLILSGNSSKNKDEVSEKEYKLNLGRIKSNLSRVNLNSSRSRSKDMKLQKVNNNNNNNYPSHNLRSYPSNNNQKEMKSNKNKRNSGSVSKNIGKENHLNVNNKYHSNNNKKNSNINSNSNNNSNNNSNYNSNNSLNKPKENEGMSRVKSKDKQKLESKVTKDNKRLSQRNQIPINKISHESIQKNPQQENNIKVINHPSNSNIEQTENNSEINSDRSITESSRVYSTNKSILGKRMESAIEHIYSLKKEELFEYTKKVIRDFLIFVQNVNNKKLKEDLESHFEVIFRILNKIFERISKIFKNLIPDELIIQSIKVIVVASCFLNPDDTTFNKANGETIRKFLERIRGFLKNDDKICAFYIDVINKFINFENNSTSFLENLNPKWVFINFIQYVRENIRINQLKCYDNFIDLIETVENSSLLSEEEKKNFLIIEEFDKNDLDAEKNIKEDNQISEEPQHSNQLESSLIRHIKNKRGRGECHVNIPDDELDDDMEYLDKNLGGANNYEHNFRDNERDEGTLGKREDSSEDHLILNKKETENINLLRKKSHSMENANRSDKDKKTSVLEDSNSNIDRDNINYSNLNNSNNKHFNNLNKFKSKSKIPDQILHNSHDEKSKIENKETSNDYDLQNDKKPTQPIYVDNIQPKTLHTNIISNTHQEFSSNPSKFCNLPEDIIDIKDKIKQKMRKLDLTIQRLGNKIDNNQCRNQTTNDETSAIHSEKDSDNLKPTTDKRSNNIKQIRSLEDFYEEEKEEMEKNSLQSNANVRNTGLSPDSFKQITIQNTSVLSNISSNSTLQQNHYDKKQVEPEFKSLILKIPSNLLDNNLSEIILYVKLESIFSKISNESKLEFSQELSNVLENTNLIKASSFNCFLQLFEFILTLLTNEMKLSYRYIHADSVKDLNKQRHQDIILKLQGTVENLLRIKDLTEIFKILVFLLKKYLPRDFSYKIDKDCLLYLKTISYLLKSAIEIKKNQNSCIRAYEILQEINELFLTSPPTMLKEGIPNLTDLDKIYKLLKILTDLSVNSSFEETRLFLSNSKKGINKSQYCQIYLNYLDNIINNSLDN